MDMRGHNSAAFSQTLSELSEVVNGKTPKRRFPYFKFYPRDWLEATRGMSLEERGAYIDFICLFMEAEGDLADDDNWIRHQMHVPKQRWRKMKSKLIEHGKISVQGDRLVNERCLRELDELMAKSTQNSKNIQKRWEKVGENLKQSSKKVETLSPEKSRKVNEIKGGGDTNVPRHARVTTDSDSEVDKKEKNTALGARANSDVAALEAKLFEACNGAAANPAVAPGILVLTEPLKWLQHGCSLDLDILPTIRARSLKLRPGSVKNWSYFTQAVADAKASREAPMPEGNAKAPSEQSQRTYSYGKYVGKVI